MRKSSSSSVIYYYYYYSFYCYYYYWGCCCNYCWTCIFCNCCCCCYCFVGSFVGYVVAADYFAVVNDGLVDVGCGVKFGYGVAIGGFGFDKPVAVVIAIEVGVEVAFDVAAEQCESVGVDVSLGG
jgi:hypothetical protein